MVTLAIRREIRDEKRKNIEWNAPNWAVASGKLDGGVG
jgi:hypothetical protein